MRPIPPATIARALCCASLALAMSAASAQSGPPQQGQGPQAQQGPNGGPPPQGGPGGQQGGQGGQQGGQGGQQGGQGGQRRGPPPQALAACASLSAGASCSFEGREGRQLSGTCFSPEPSLPLACRPAHRRQEGAGAGPQQGQQQGQRPPQD